MNGIDQRAHNFVWLLCLRRWLDLPAADLTVSVHGAHTQMSASKIRSEDKLRFRRT
jgi:hypothetical protein